MYLFILNQIFSNIFILLLLLLLISDNFETNYLSFIYDSIGKLLGFSYKNSILIYTYCFIQVNKYIIYLLFI